MHQALDLFSRYIADGKDLLDRSQMLLQQCEAMNPRDFQMKLERQCRGEAGDAGNRLKP